MLVYSILHLSGYGVSLDDLKNFRQLGSPTAGPPRVRGRRRPGHRGDHRPARPGHLQRDRLRARRAHARRALQPRRPRGHRPPHVRDSQRRRPPGGRVVRGLLARRPPRARPADGLLRQQPHPARGPDRLGLLRGRRQAVRGLRLARAGPRRGHLARAPGGRDRGRTRGDGQAVADHAADAHRVRLTQQGRQPEGARLAARRGRGTAHQGGLRLGPGRAFPRARRGVRALRRARRGAGRRRGRVERAFRGLQERPSGPRG